MTETTIKVEVQAVEVQALELSNIAKTLAVRDEATYREAGELLKALKDIKGQVVARHENIKKRTHEAWKQACADEKKYLSPLDDADKMLRAEVGKYLDEQERIRSAAQSKAEEEARVAAEKEKQKLLEQAIKAEEKGKAEKAEALIEKAESVYVEPVIIPSAVEKTSRLENGSVTRKSDIQVIVVDPVLLIKAIAENKVPVSVVEFKLNAIKNWAKLTGVKNGQMFGLTIKETQCISIR